MRMQFNSLLLTIICIVCGCTPAFETQLDSKLQLKFQPKTLQAEHLAELNRLKRLNALPQDLENVLAFSDSFKWHYALSSNGSIWFWSRSDDQASRDPSMYIPPTRVMGVSDAVAIDMDSGNSAVMKSDGSVWCWQRSLGYIQPRNLNCPFKPVAIDAASDRVLALSKEGIVWQLLWDAQTSNSKPADKWEPVFGGVTQIYANHKSFYAARSDGTLVAWGSDDISWNGFGAYRVMFPPRTYLPQDETAESLVYSFGQYVGTATVTQDGDAINITRQHGKEMPLRGFVSSGVGSVGVAGLGFGTRTSTAIAMNPGLYEQFQLSYVRDIIGDKQIDRLTLEFIEVVLDKTSYPSGLGLYWDDTGDTWGAQISVGVGKQYIPRQKRGAGISLSASGIINIGQRDKKFDIGLGAVLSAELSVVF